jgi:hypothetical protein
MGGSGSANFFLNFSTNAGTAAEEMVAGFEPGIQALRSLIGLMEQYDAASERMGGQGGTPKGAAGGAQSQDIEAAATRLTTLQDKITTDLQRTLTGLESVMSKFGSMETGVVEGVGKATAAVQGLMGEVTSMLERVNAAAETTGKVGANTAGKGGTSTTGSVRAGVQQVQIVPGQTPLPVRIVSEGVREPRPSTKTATTATQDASKGVATSGKPTTETAPVVVPPAGQASAALGELKQTLAQLNASAAEAKKISEGAQRRAQATPRVEATQPATPSGSRNAPVNTPAPTGPTYVSPKSIGGGFENLDPAVQRSLVGIRGTLNNPNTPADFRNKALATATAKFQADPYYGQIADPAKVFRQATGVIPESYGTRGTPSELFRRQQRSYLSENFKPPPPAGATPEGASGDTSAGAAAKARIQSIVAETEGNNALRNVLLGVESARSRLAAVEAKAASSTEMDASAVNELSQAYRNLARAEEQAANLQARQAKAAGGGGAVGGIGGGSGSGDPAKPGAAFFGKQGLTSGLQRHAGLAIENTLTYGVVFTGIEKLREVIKDGLDAQNSFVRLQAALDANGTSAGNLRSSILGISAATAQPIEQVTDAASHLAGILGSTAEIDVGTKIAAQLANISQGTLTATEAAQGLVDVIAAYGLTGTESLKGVGDQIALLHNLTGVNVKDITQGTTQIAQEAHEFGLTQPQASTLAAYVSRGTGQTGEQSASQLSRMLGGMYNGKVQTTLIKSGVATSEQFRQGDIAGAFTDLISKYDKLEPSQRQQIASLLGQGIQARAFAAAMNLGAKGVAAMNGNLDTNNALSSLNSKYLMTISGSVKELSEDFQNLGTELQQVGAFDFIEILAKSIDLLFKSLDKTLGLIARFTGNNPLLTTFTHLSVFALEAAAALKIFGGTAASALGARGLIAPTAASVAARRAVVAGAARDGAIMTERELAAAAPLAYGRVNLRQSTMALTGRTRVVGQAERMGLSAAEYEAMYGAQASRSGLARFGQSSRNMLIGRPPTDAAAAEASALAKAMDADTAAISEYITAVKAATVASGDSTTATIAGTAAMTDVAAAAERAALALGVITRGPISGAARVGESGAAAGSLAAGGTRAQRAAARAEAAAAGTSGTVPIPVNRAGIAGGAAEAERAAAQSASRFGAIKAAGWTGALPIGGLAGAAVPLAGMAAVGTLGYEIYKGFKSQAQDGKDLNSDVSSLFNQKADAPGSEQTYYAPRKSLNRTNFTGRTIVGGLESAATFLSGGGFRSFQPQTGPSEKSQNAALAFSLKEIKAAAATRNAPKSTIKDIQQAELNIDTDFVLQAQDIAKMGGNDKASQDAIIRSLENTHQGIIDSNARRIQILTGLANIDGALSPTQIAGLSNYASSVTGATQAEVATNPQAYVEALKASNVTEGSPEFKNSLKALGIKEVVETAPSANKAGAGYQKLLAKQLPGAKVTIAGIGGGSINAGELQDYLANTKGSAGIADALQQAIAAGTPQALQDFATKYGYQATGAGGTATITGTGGKKVNTGKYAYDPSAVNNSQTRFKAAIDVQQAIIDSSQNILGQGKLIGNRVVTSDQADAAGKDSTLYTEYHASKAATYAPGTEQYNSALQTLTGASQTQGQLIDAKAQQKFQAPQGAAQLQASIGSDSQALGNLGQANSQIKNYISANKLGAGDSQYWSLMQQIQQNKQTIAQLENSPALNSLLLASASTNDAVRKAGLAGQQARLKLQTDQAGGADSITIGQDKAAIASADMSETQARQGVDTSRAGVSIAQKRNSISKAQMQYNETLRQANLAQNSATADAATYYQLQAQAATQLQALHDAIEAQTQSTYDVTAALDKVHNDALGGAQNDLNKARQAYNYAISQYGKNSQQANEAMAQVITAQGAVQDAQLAIINANLDVTIAQLTARGQSGDLQQAARMQVQKIQNQMSEYLKKGGSTGSSGYKELQAQLATAQRNAFDVQLQQQLALLDFQRATYKITSAQEVQALQEILKNKQLTLAEQQSITLQIKSLQDSVREQLTQGGMNIPSGIVFPTAYDVRRSLGAGFQSDSASASVGAGTGASMVNSNNTTTVTIQASVASAADADNLVNKVVVAINKQTGQQASATTSTPRLVPMG